jgi:hypothetical protein
VDVAEDATFKKILAPYAYSGNGSGVAGSRDELWRK